MSESAQPNEAERRHWNDESWTTAWPRREQLTSAVTSILLDHLRPGAGEKVLDIGSGGGTTALAVSPLVGDGAVVGADISAPLVEYARRRLADHGAANVSFVVADMQVAEIAGGPFDAALSQFGVMFFDEPAVAFANIRQQLVPGGRLAFACWQSATHNPWFVGPILAEHLPPPPPPAPGKSRTGPFSLSDPDRVRALLRQAGWDAAEGSAHELVVSVDRSALIDEDQLASLDMPEAALEQVRHAVDARLEELSGAQGRIERHWRFRSSPPSRDVLTWRHPCRTVRLGRDHSTGSRWPRPTS